MNIGREILHSLLSGGDIRTVLDAGLNKNWLEGENTGSSVVFNGIDKQAYRWVLSHYDRYRTTPSTEIFRQHFPEETLKFNKKVIPVDELVGLVEDKVSSFLVADVIGRAIDLHDSGKIAQATTLLGIERGIKARKVKADDLSSSSFDLETFLNTELTMGIPFGMDTIDEDFYGFQPGMLITLMGRQKSESLGLLLISNVRLDTRIHCSGYSQLEWMYSILRQRVWCLGANVSPSRMRRGRLTETEKEKVRQFQSILSEDEGTFLISKRKAGITVEAIKEEVK